MEHLPINEAKWLHQQKKPWPPKDFAREGTAVHHLIPPVYESYGRILHPFETDVEQPDSLEPNSQYGKQVSIAMSHLPDGGISIREQRADGTVVDLHEEFLRRKEERHRQKLVPTTWRSVAGKYGLTFHAAIHLNSYVARFQEIGWPRNLSFPSEGFLPRNLLLSLLSSLKEHAPGAEVCIYQWPPHTIFKEGRTEDLVRCPAEEVPEYFEEGFVGYLFGADRSWVVFTDTDFHFTLVGGSKALIESLKGSSMEVVECEATTRLDENADHLNERPVLPTRIGAAPPERPHPERHSIFSRLKQWLTGK